MVLILEDKEREIQPLQLRNQINAKLQTLGYKEQTITGVAKSSKGNIVLTFPDTRASEIANRYKETIEQIIGKASALESSTWFKVVVYGVPTKLFNTLTGLGEIQDEIETYNRGLKLASKPIWLSNAEKRNSQSGATVLLGFATKVEADRAIQNRLYIAAESLYVEAARDRPNVRQKPNQQSLSQRSKC
jgi:hypothetical protein